MDYTRTLVMACATVIEEMLPLLPPGMQHQVFDFGLHVNPERLRRTLQAAIDAVGEPSRRSSWATGCARRRSSASPRRAAPWWPPGG